MNVTDAARGISVRGSPTPRKGHFPLLHYIRWAKQIAEEKVIFMRCEDRQTSIKPRTNSQRNRFGGARAAFQLYIAFMVKPLPLSP